MRYLRIIFHPSVPFYFWIGIVYVIFVMAMVFIEPTATDAPVAGEATQTVTVDATERPGCIIVGDELYERVESALNCSIVTIPLFSNAEFTVTWTVLFIIMGFSAAWIEVVRATQIRSTARNDMWSLIVTIAAFVLFVGVSSFGTTAFMIVALTGFGDVLLDRYVGQAVARRDFGGVIGGGG